MTVRQQGRTASARRRTGAATDPYGDVVLADGPAAWWRGNGTAADEVSGGTAGTLIGATYGTALLPARPSAQTFNLDGVDDYVSIPNQAKLALTTNLSLEAWINADTLTGFGSIAVYGGSTTASPNYGIQHNDVGQIGFFLRGPATTNLYVARSAGTTYHLVGTYDGATARFYIDGTQVATAAHTTVGTNAGTFRIGSWDGANEYFDGRIAEVAVYNRVLTATEVSEHYTAGTTP